MKMRNKGTDALRLTLHALTLTVLVLVVAGCSGSKVTTKSSAELPRYQIRTIALVPFTTLATPQARDVADQIFSVPPDVLRSDIGRAVPQNIERPLSQTVTVPTGAGDIVTQLLWSRLRVRQGVTVLSPNEAAKTLVISVGVATFRRSVTGDDGGKTAQSGCFTDRPSVGVSGTSRWSLWRQSAGNGGV